MPPVSAAKSNAMAKRRWGEALLCAGLLIVTGMETDLALVRRTGKAALSVSLAGIAVPFLCGIALGEALPDSMLPHPDQRLVTTLFIGTALAIASVKIVALTIRELDF